MKLPLINKKALKKVLFGVYISVIFVIGIYLFFGDQIAFVINSTTGGEDRYNQLHATATPISLGFAYKPESLDPVRFDPVTRNYLIDIYEGLVLTDRDLKIVPGLAISWGLINANKWEFILRPDVKFHDGSLLTPRDVVNSILRARDDQKSQLKDLLGTIKDLKIVDKNRIRITTRIPDPLLLNKLALTYIYPEKLSDFSKPVGTGPYSYVVSDDKKLILRRFEEYWDVGRGFHSQIILNYIKDREERLDALEKNELQILTDLPPLAAVTSDSKYASSEGVVPIQNPDIEIKAIPSLEVSFIVFNVNNPIFSDKNAREAVYRALDPQFFVDLTYGFARPVNQFVSNGVFGYNPAIKRLDYDMEEAKELVKSSIDLTSFDVKTVVFDYPESMEAVGQYVQQQLSELGINVELNPLKNDKLQEKIQSGNSELYYLGWKSDLGDAGDFLDSIAHTRALSKGYGLFNGGNYSNVKVDKLIEKSRQNFDVKSRQKDLQEAMRIIAEEDIMAVPLYESDTIFAYRKSIKFEPRIDGYLHGDEIE